MSEYCEYMWNPTRRPLDVALARSLYDENGRIEVRDKKLAVKTVRAILRSMPGVDLKQCTDEYVTRFLLARKYRTEQAAALIAAYQAQITHRQDIFGNLTARDPALQRALRAGIPGVLPARDRKGRCILVILASQWDPIAVPALAVQRAIFLVLEILIQDPRNQYSGFVAVVDWSGFSLRQGGALGTAALRNLIAALRGRFPARFKAVHFLSSPLCVQATLAIVKPFLDEKTRNKIFLHGNNLSTLHEHLPTDILPADLGGTGPAFNPGLWAEPVIHSAMKEAELAAIKRDKEKAEKAEMAKNVDNTSIPDDQSKKDSEIVENSKIDDLGKNNDNTNVINDRQKTDNITKDIGHTDLPRKSEESVHFDDTIRVLDVGISDKHNEKSAQGPLLDFTDEQTDKDNGNVKKDVVIAEIKEQNPMFKDENKNGEDLRTQYSEYKDETGITESLDNLEVLKEDIESLEIDSETNSNEFEMVPSQLENEDNSKDNSLDLKVEKIIVKSGKSRLPEEANLIT